MGMWVKMFVQLSFYSMIYPSIRSYVVIQFCVCFCPSVCLPVRILSVYVSRPSLCSSARLYAYFCVIMFVTLLVCMFPFRSLVLPSVLSSSVRMIMHACKSVVYKHVRDIPFF